LTYGGRPAWSERRGFAMRQIRVWLVGGPAGLSQGDRIREVDTLGNSIKVPRGNGYDHFTYSGESRELDGTPLPVFKWSYQTKIAE
jgi:hypothetical protein